jgi:hypothetical protein
MGMYTDMLVDQQNRDILSFRVILECRLDNARLCLYISLASLVLGL